jgi:DNA-binding response OmpR family regulator
MIYGQPAGLLLPRPHAVRIATISSAPARILVADDDEDVRDLVAMTLRMAGYAVATACDGQDALTMLAQQAPDLMVLDVVMPGTSGYAICAALRERPVTATLPVILMTAKADTDAVRAGYEAGANRYLTKPIDFRRLLREIRSLL